MLHTVLGMRQTQINDANSIHWQVLQNGQNGAFCFRPNGLELSTDSLRDPALSSSSFDRGWQLSRRKLSLSYRFAHNICSSTKSINRSLWCGCYSRRRQYGGEDNAITSPSCGCVCGCVCMWVCACMSMSIVHLCSAESYSISTALSVLSNGWTSPSWVVAWSYCCWEPGLGDCPVESFRRCIACQSYVSVCVCWHDKTKTLIGMTWSLAQ